MKRTVFFVIILSMATALGARAERYYHFDHVTSKDGLSSNTIYSTTQDSYGFMWIGTRDGLSRYDGNNFVNIRDIVSGEGLDGNISTVCEDNLGRIWFSSNSGLNIYNPLTGTLEQLGTLNESTCHSIQSDGKGRVWLLTNEIVRVETATMEMKSYRIEGHWPSGMTIDSYGSLWVMMRDGSLYIYDARTEEFEHRQCGHIIRRLTSGEEGKLLVLTDRNQVMYLDCITLEEDVVFTARKGQRILNMIERTQGECWIGTNEGLFIRRAGDDYKGEAFHDAATPQSLSADYITSLGKDRDGNVWVGTYYKGINIWKDHWGDIGMYFSNPSGNSIKGTIVRSICEDESGHIWFCTEDGWLNRYNPTTHTIANYQLAEDTNLQGIVADGKKMWICSYGDGVWLMNRESGRIMKHYDLPNNTTTLGIKSAKGQIFIGTTSGLYRYDETSDSFDFVENAGMHFVHSLYQSSDGVIWVGTYGNGIRCIDEEGNRIARISASKNEGELTSGIITSFHEDASHRMWITTGGGGVYYTDKEYDITAPYLNNLTSDDGLPSDIACAIAEDADGMLWISTTNGIAYMDGKTFMVTEIINGDDESTGNQFSYGAVCTTRNGVFYFGNTDGMISIVPSMMKNRRNTERLIITDIHAKDKDRFISLCGEGKSAMNTSEVEVKHKNASSIHIAFVCPEYSSRKPLYSYSLTRGKSKRSFIGTTEDNDVSFTGLRPGNYRFDVWITGRENIEESHRTILIDIKPHPMLSTGAKTLYILLGLGLFSAFAILVHKRIKRNKRRQHIILENKKEKDIYNAKINFFTNITHEIRTPLTLIKMPIDKILASGAYNASNEKNLRIIQANTDRLLNLTNQLLDMRKMEHNEISLSFIKEDICDIVRSAMRLFEQMAADQHITMNCEIPDEPVYIMCAKDSVLSIVSNLISNAVKYGNGLINVRLQKSDDEQSVIIRVESNGEIITGTDRENIFKLFFQREGAEKGVHGTGLGLPYARTMANMHNGRLFLDDAVTEMNSFVLELPVKQAEQITIEQVNVEHDPELPAFDNSRHTILLAEDSAEMRSYLAKELSEAFNVFTAANGADALEIAKNEKIDLVVSDVMMPIMDGCELCNRIKADSDLSHVPVILLTAAVGIETRMETLKSGADGYIEKPFPIELLISNINNLFRNKEISYKQFISKPLTHYNSVTASNVDQEYMDKVHEFIMKHISEPDLNIESLTMQIGTSKSSLYRKLKANTGLSINEYIRLCRLKQAAELLSSQKYKINEVAFMTGFSSPSYFATCFLKQFNITPSEFVKNLGQ